MQYALRRIRPTTPPHLHLAFFEPEALSCEWRNEPNESSVKWLILCAKLLRHWNVGKRKPRARCVPFTAYSTFTAHRIKASAAPISSDSIGTYCYRILLVLLQKWNEFDWRALMRCAEMKIQSSMDLIACPFPLPSEREALWTTFAIECDSKKSKRMIWNLFSDFIQRSRTSVCAMCVKRFTEKATWSDTKISRFCQNVP